jgi:anti-sigma regulatory factor (Ser/Thr protein kinase)
LPPGDRVLTTFEIHTRLHAMRPANESEVRLRPESAAPSLARAAIAAAASGEPAVVVADAELLTSEVVSNAVRHAELDPSQEIVVRIVADGYVRVEVVDQGPPFEVDLRRTGSGSSGWGLFLVDAVASSWGVEREGSGKRVWFEVGERRGGR